MAMRKATFDLDPEDYDRFRIYADARKISTSEAIRILMRNYLRAVDKYIDQKRGAELVAAEKRAIRDQIDVEVLLREAAK